MARSDVHPVHKFESWQVWPGSFDNPPVDGRFPVPPNPGLKITPITAIASIGSCFAREIKRRLIQRGYNYITEETDHPASVHASAAWERVYNTFCLRQIFEYTFEDWAPDLRWWIAPQSQKVQDPYRRVILYDNIGTASSPKAAITLPKSARIALLSCLKFTGCLADKEEASRKGTHGNTGYVLLHRPGSGSGRSS